MAKKYPNIQTLEVYQEGGDTQQVTPCPDATIDQDLNLDNRERAISRFNYGKANSEDKCGNCILFDISKRIKKDSIDLVENEGFYEYFDPTNKKNKNQKRACGSNNFSWTAALYLDFYKRETKN